MPTSPDTHEYSSIEEIETRFKELRGELRTAIKTGGQALEGQDALLNEVNALDALYTTELRAAGRTGFERTGPEAATTQVTQLDTRSAGQVVFDSQEFRTWVEYGCQGNSPAVSIDRGIRANVFSWGSGGPPNASAGDIQTLLPVGQPIAPLPRKAPLMMRDLLPVQPTGLSVIPYVRELNPTTYETGASVVAEGAVKPDQSILFSGATANVTVIAGNITVSKQIFEDAQTVMGYINGRLPYLVAYREDAEILNGNGVWPDLLGILNTPGLQTQAATSGEAAITIANAVAKVENADGNATAVVMNPVDAWAMFTKRAAGGSGTFDAGTPFSDIPLTVWGLPVKRGRTYPAGSALVGDWAMGGILFDREQVSVQVYPQHSDYPIRNQVLLQAEERITVAWPRPDLFVKATLS